MEQCLDAPGERTAMRMTIKRYPDDFNVEEILCRETASRISEEPGPFALYRLAKRGLGTDEALDRIAAALSVPLASIGYAGLKDKHASTVQYITIDVSRLGAERAPRTLEAPGLKLERIGWLEDRVSADAMSGNRFRITLRSLTRRRCAQLDDAREFLSVPRSRGKTLRFVNYYGEQRFGSARHGQGFAARHLIGGNIEEALRLLIAVPDRKDPKKRKAAKLAIAAGWGSWRRLAETLPACPERRVVERLAATGGDFREGFSALPYFIRQMTIEAYQSWLWNEVARRVIAGRCMPPFIRAVSRFGDLVFPRAAAIPAGIISLTVPLFSPQVSLVEPWRAAAEDVLAGEGISLQDLRIPGMRKPYFGAVARALFAEAAEFSLGPVERDESSTDATRFKRNVKFFLPRGSYGTVLLQALGAWRRSAITSGAQSIL